MRVVAILLLAAMATPHGAVAEDPQKLALVVGNGRYAQLEPLPAAAAAAQRMTRVLKTLNFEVIEVTEGSNGRISAGLQAFAERARPGAVTVVYYVGHVAEFEGRTFLLPVTAKLRQGFDILHEGIMLGAIRGVVERAEPSFGMLVLESSRESGVAAVADTLLPSRGDLGRVRDGLAIVSAAGEDEVLDPAEPFALTDALIAALERPEVELGALLAELPDAVSERSGGKRPWMSGGTDGAVWLRGEPPSPELPPSPPIPAAVVTPEAATAVDEDAAPGTMSQAVETAETAPSGPDLAAPNAATVGDVSEDLESLLTPRQRRTIQSSLRNLGHYDHRIDGVFGEGTRQAVRAYQKNLGEPETGRLSAGQIARLLTGADRRMSDGHDSAQ